MAGNSQDDSMNELRQILKVYQQARERGEPSVLATVTSVEGSSYRRPGARMLITQDFRLTGCVSGGCLERDLIRKAALALESKESLLLNYDNRDDTESEEDDRPRLGCRGFIEILLEPIYNGHQVLDRFQRWLKERVNGGLVLFPKNSKKAPLFIENDRFPNNAETPLLLEWENAKKKGTFSKDLLLGSESALTRVFFEPFPLPLRVILIGAGYDVVAASALAIQLGHEVKVVDLRSSVPVPQGAFKGVSGYVRCAPCEINEHVEIDDKTAVVVMTHNAEDDQKVLPHVLEKNPAYVGLLGPRYRGEELMREKSDEESHVYFPTGLDIGAETPNEIALAIFAEIDAVLKKRTGGHLKNRVGPIHDW